jgi:hypothetical protein
VLVTLLEVTLAQKKQDRCWPGYEPVKGKPAHSEGSCRPKPESKTTPSEKEFRAKRRKQLDEWQELHPGTRRSASQHLKAPGVTKKTTSKRKSASKKPSR